MRCNVYSTNRRVCRIDVIREAHNTMWLLIDSLVTYAWSRNQPSDECRSIHRIDPRTNHYVNCVISVSVAHCRWCKFSTRILELFAKFLYFPMFYSNSIAPKIWHLKSTSCKCSNISWRQEGHLADPRRAPGTRGPSRYNFVHFHAGWPTPLPRCPKLKTWIRNWDPSPIL